MLHKNVRGSGCIMTQNLQDERNIVSTCCCCYCHCYKRYFIEQQIPALYRLSACSFLSFELRYPLPGRTQCAGVELPANIMNISCVSFLCRGPILPSNHCFLFGFLHSHLMQTELLSVDLGNEEMAVMSCYNLCSLLVDVLSQSRGHHILVQHIKSLINI